MIISRSAIARPRCWLKRCASSKDLHTPRAIRSTGSTAIATERDFVYVTTAHLTHDQLQQLSDEVGQDRTLLVLCTAFRARADQFSNLTVKKIPKAVLSRCEYGHDDYSLQVENLPQAPREPGQQGLFEEGDR